MTHTLKHLFTKISQETLKFTPSFNTTYALPILRDYSGIDWKNHIQYNENTYNRVHLYSHPMFDAYLLCWLPKQFTETHNHCMRGCIFKVLEGTLVEERFYRSTILQEGTISGISDNRIYHNISNFSINPAISLHIYGKNDSKIT